jgi:hypothetical protein
MSEINDFLHSLKGNDLDKAKESLSAALARKAIERKEKLSREIDNERTEGKA